MYSSVSKSPGLGAVIQSEPDVYISPEEKKEKKMGWFTRWFDRKCREAWERARNEPQPPAVLSGHRRNQIDSNGLRLTIYGADGGTVLEFNHYEIKTDRHNNTLHVIGNNENFEERVAQAITMEMLRKGIGN